MTRKQKKRKKKYRHEILEVMGDGLGRDIARLKDMLNTQSSAILYTCRDLVKEGVLSRLKESGRVTYYYLTDQEEEVMLTDQEAVELISSQENLEEAPSHFSSNILEVFNLLKDRPEGIVSNKDIPYSGTLTNRQVRNALVYGYKRDMFRREASDGVQANGKSCYRYFLRQDIKSSLPSVEPVEPSPSAEQFLTSVQNGGSPSWFAVPQDFKEDVDRLFSMSKEEMEGEEERLYVLLDFISSLRAFKEVEEKYGEAMSTLQSKLAGGSR